MNKAVTNIAIDSILGPKQSDKFGDFYLVRGEDGGLYRQNFETKNLYLLVPEGDWDMVPEDTLDNMNMKSNQQGIDSLNGEKLILASHYSPTYISDKLLEISTLTEREEDLKYKQNLDKHIENANLDPFHPRSLEEDADLMPPEDNNESLQEFLKDNMDTLAQELNK